MVAYSFKSRFALPILDGVKQQTIRPVGRRRHARPGDELQLYVGQRTRQCRLVSRAACTAALAVLIDLRANEIIVEGRDYPLASDYFARRSGEDWDICGVAYCRRGDLDAFARRDGFSEWAEMRAFWTEEHGEPEEDDVFVGKLIGWWPK